MNNIKLPINSLLTKHKSYNLQINKSKFQNRFDPNNLKMNKSEKNIKSKKSILMEPERRKSVIERRSRKPLPSYDFSSRFLGQGSSLPNSNYKKETRNSNVTISSNVPCQMYPVVYSRSLVKEKLGSSQKKISQKTKQKVKQFEIQNHSLYQQPNKGYSKFMFQFDSFNNSNNQVPAPDSSKMDEMSHLGKRSEININNQKDIFRVESYDSLSRDYVSHLSSFKKRKMSESSKPKESLLKENSEFDSTHTMNQPGTHFVLENTDFTSSLLNYKGEKVRVRQKKIRHSTGMRGIQNKRNASDFCKFRYMMNLQNISNFPRKGTAKKKNGSVQNLSSLGDFYPKSTSIKNRVSSNTLSSNSKKNVSSLPEIEKKSMTPDKPQKELTKVVLDKILESNIPVKKQ